MSFGIRASLSSPLTFPLLPISSRAAMNFMECLVHVSIHPLHNICCTDILDKPQGVAPPCACCRADSAFASSHTPCSPPPLVLSSKLWLSEWRNMCVIQVLLQHSSMQLPKEIPRGTL